MRNLDRYKFRGKRADNGEWMYGCLRVLAFNAGARIAEPMCEPIDVDPATVGQWTGLKDKHGVDIYEGDTVDISNGGRWDLDEYRSEEVVHCGVRGFSPWDEVSGQIDLNYLASENPQHITITGNIHDKAKEQG